MSVERVTLKIGNIKGNRLLNRGEWGRKREPIEAWNEENNWSKKWSVRINQLWGFTRYTWILVDVINQSEGFTRYTWILTDVKMWEYLSIHRIELILGRWTIIGGGIWGIWWRDYCDIKKPREGGELAEGELNRSLAVESESADGETVKRESVKREATEGETQGGESEKKNRRREWIKVGDVVPGYRVIYRQDIWNIIAN